MIAEMASEIGTRVLSNAQQIQTLRILSVVLALSKGGNDDEVFQTHEKTCTVYTIPIKILIACHAQVVTRYQKLTKDPNPQTSE